MCIQNTVCGDAHAHSSLVSSEDEFQHGPWPYSLHSANLYNLVNGQVGYIADVHGGLQAPVCLPR